MHGAQLAPTPLFWRGCEAVTGHSWPYVGVYVGSYIHGHTTPSGILIVTLRILPVISHTSPGAGESGKSTIVKQMKILHKDGYTEE